MKALQLGKDETQESSQTDDHEVRVEHTEAPTAEAYSEVYDPISGHYYYFNIVTGESTWERPPDFDKSASEAAIHRLCGSGQALSELPNGLAMLIATRKIQGAFRKKQARKKLRQQRANVALQKLEGAPPDNEWMEIFDPHSQHYYYYNTVTGESTWERPTT